MTATRREFRINELKRLIRDYAELISYKRANLPPLGVPGFDFHMEAIWKLKRIKGEYLDELRELEGSE